MFTNHQLSYLLSELEELPGPEEATLGNLWVWPLMRVQIVYACFTPIKEKALLHKRSLARNFVARTAAYKKIVKEFLSIYQNKIYLQKYIRRDQDVVCMVLPSRWKRGVESMSEKDAILGRILDGLSISDERISLWTEEECGNQSPPVDGVVSFSRLLSKSISFLRVRQYFLGLPPEPSWHRLIASYCHDNLGILLHWHATYRHYLYIQAMKKTFYHALSISSPRLMLSSCWYNYGTTASILAAKSLGIKVVEVQHGIQENFHPCYHGWKAVPKSTSAIHPFPDEVLVWGRMSKSLYNNHSLVKRTLVVGSEFLSDQINPKVPRHQISFNDRLSIGYSLTWPLEPLISGLQATIRACPTSWSWILRLHPSDLEGSHLLRDLISRNPDSHILISHSSDCNVQEFLSSVDVHLTHESSCSLQALAFGMPTLITTAHGAKNFQYWIDKAVMLYSNDVLSIESSILGLLEIDPVKALNASHEIFGSETDFRHAMAIINAAVRRET